MSEAAEFIDGMMRTDAGQFRAPADELRQEAWVAVLEHGCDREAVRAAWRKATRGDRLPKVANVHLWKGQADGYHLSDGWRMDWVPDQSQPIEPVELPVELVDPNALAFVEAVMLDGADFDTARAAVGYNRKTAERTLRAAGLTKTGKRIEHHRPDVSVEGLAAYRQRTRPTWQVDFAAVAREMGHAAHRADQLIRRWEAQGAIDMNRTPTGRRQFDWVNVAGLMVLGRAHKIVADYNRAGTADQMPANWAQLRRVLESKALHVRFTPGLDRWFNGWASHAKIGRHGKPLESAGGEHRIALRSIRARAQRIVGCDGEANPARCACGCGRPLQSDNRSGIASVCRERDRSLRTTAEAWSA